MKTIWTLIPAMALAAISPESRLTLISDAPELRLVDGTGSVTLTFRKAAGAAVPRVEVDDMTDSFGNVVPGAGSFTASWIGPGAPESEEAFISLRVSTIRALPQLEARTRLLFRWPDGVWHITMTVKTVAADLSNRLTQLTQGTGEIYLLDGHAEPIRLTFTKPAGVKRPQQVLIRSPKEGNVVLGSDHFEAVWEGPWPDWRQAGTVTLRVRLKDNEALPQFTRATGQIVFRWREGEGSPVAFTVIDASARQFTVEPAPLVVNLTWRQVPEVSLNVTNTGPAPITSVAITGSEFREEGGSRRVAFPKTIWTATTPRAAIRQSQVDVIKVALPRPGFAGSYQGTVYLSANGSPPKQVTLTIKTRGPGGQADIPWPFILFFTTLSLGYAAARLLEYWLDLGGKERTEALLALTRAWDAIKESYDRLKQEYPNVAPMTVGAADSELMRIQETLRNSGKTVQELKAAQQRAERIAGGLVCLFRNLDFVRQTQPTSLADIGKKMDRLDPTADGYESQVAALARPTVDREEVAVTGAPRVGKYQKRFKLKWLGMEVLYAATTFVAVFVVAYLTVYHKAPAYGQVNDHLQTLLYGLGLSSAGTQVLNKARSSTVKTA